MPIKKKSQESSLLARSNQMEGVDLINTLRYTSFYELEVQIIQLRLRPHFTTIDLKIKD
jgi:hypothetical protein